MNSSDIAAARVFVQIVTFKSLVVHGRQALESCIKALTRLKGYKLGVNLTVVIRDNASEDGAAEFFKETCPSEIVFKENRYNLGFCGGQNQGVKEFLDGDAGYLLVLNPDIALQAESLSHLVQALECDARAGMATPKLYRADAQLEPLKPLRLDAAGMRLTAALRHFDRGSGCAEDGSWNRAEYVFGGTGACLLLKREFVEDMIFDLGEYEPDLGRVYPALLGERDQRAQLFDEAFFAYREDADLAWRAAQRGWMCRYVPEAQAFHRRVVLPERRSELAPELNLLGVKNRFLLQINNYTLGLGWRVFWEGLILRNLLVLLAVIFKEHSSLRAFKELYVLSRRAKALRRLTRQRRRIKPAELAKWFAATSEDLD